MFCQLVHVISPINCTSLRPIFKNNDSSLIWNNIKSHFTDEIDRKSLTELSITDLFKIDGQNLDNFDEISVYIKNYKTELEKSSSAGEAFIETLTRSNKSLADYIQNNDVATLSAENFYASQLKQTTGFMGVRKAIATYNLASKNGIETQTAYAQAVGQSNSSLGNYLTGLNGASGSMKGYLGSLVKAKAATIALNVATAALNMAVTAGVSWLVSKGLEEINYLINRREIAFEKAKEEADEAKRLTEEYKSENQQLNELISKYKELAESENSDTPEIKKEIYDIQASITEMVGQQAENLDLVNGKLDEELEKLKDIEETSFKDYIYKAEESYKKAAKETHTYDKLPFDDEEQTVEGHIKEIDDTLEKLRPQISTNKELKEQYDVLLGYRNEFSDLVTEQTNAANQYISGLVAQGVRNGQNDVTDFNDYQELREQLIKSITSDETVKQIIGDGVLDKKAIEKSLDNYLATVEPLSDFYNQWLTKQQPSLSEAEARRFAEESRAKIQTAVDSSQKVSLEKLFDIEDDDGDTFRERIDAFKSSKSELEEALNDLAMGESPYEDLIDKYPELIGHTDDLDVAINNLLSDLNGQMYLDFTNQFGKLDTESDREQLIAYRDALIGIDSGFDISDYESKISKVKETSSTLKSALESLNSGESLAIDFYMEFPDLLPYAKNTDVLKEKISELIAQNPKKLISELNDLKQSLNTDKEREQVKALISLLQNLGETEDEISAKAIFDNLETQCDNIIDKLEDERDVQQKNLDSLKAQKEELEEIISNYEKVADIVTKSIDDNQISDLESKKSEIEDYYNTEIEKLREENEERDRNIDLQEKQAALENARKTKVRVYSELEGWHYEQDTSAVKAAEKDLADTQNNYAIEDLEKQRDDETSAIDEQIQAWEDYKERWTEQVEQITQADDILLASKILGSDWQENIAEKDIGVLNNFASEYGGYKNKLNNNVESEISSIEKAIKEKDDQITEWTNYKNSLSKWSDEVDTINRTYITNLKNIANDEKLTLQERLENLRSFIDEQSKLNGVDIPNGNSLGGGISALAGGESANKIVVRYDGKKIAEVSSTKEAEQEKSEYLGNVVSQEVNTLTQKGVRVSSAMMQEIIDNLKNKFEILSPIGSFASGGAVDYTGLANVHGSQSRSEVLFNSAQAKRLYELFSNNSLNELKEKLFSGIISSSKDINNISRVQKSNTNNSYSWNINGDIKADSYAEFCKYMDRYTTEAMARFKVGK